MENVKLDFKALLKRLGSWLVREGKVTGKKTVSEFKKSSKDTKKLVVGAACILLGVVVPWNLFGDFGGYVQAGLIIGGALVLFEESGRGSKKKKKEGIIF